MKKLLGIAAVSTVLSLLTAGVADAATYIASRTVGNGSADISITTDGTIGVLAASNILDWNIVLTQGADTFTLKGPASGANSALALDGEGLSATATDLLFDFSQRGFLLIQAPKLGSSVTFWCLQRTGCVNSGAGEAVLASTKLGTSTYQAYSGVQTIASLSSAVPEPATWTMMILGFGLVGTMTRRRRLHVVAA